MKRETPRYKVQPTRAGDYAVLDTRTVQFVATFGNEPTAQARADKLNA